MTKDIREEEMKKKLLRLHKVNTAKILEEMNNKNKRKSKEPGMEP